MTVMEFSKWYFILLATSLAASSIGAEPVNSCPSKETSLYLGELLRRNEPGISDLGVVLAQSYTPIELLFDEEVLRPRFGSALVRTATATLIVEYPEKCSYLTRERLKSLASMKYHYSVLPIQNIRAFAVVNETCLPKDGPVIIVTTIIEATFREQTDNDKDGKWDRETCWEVVKSTRKEAHSRHTTAKRAGADEEPPEPMND